MFNVTNEDSIRINEGLQLQPGGNDTQSPMDNSPPKAKTSGQTTASVILSLFLHFVIPLFALYMIFLAILRWRRKREQLANSLFVERGNDNSYRDAQDESSQVDYISRDMYRSNLSSMLLTKKVLDAQGATSTQHNITGTKGNIYINTYRNDTSSTDSNDLVCNICLSGYNVGEEICYSRNPNCSHMFHKECILEWLVQHNDCPNCREQFLDPSFDDCALARGISENNNQVFSDGVLEVGHIISESHIGRRVTTPTPDEENQIGEMSYLTPVASEDTFATAAQPSIEMSISNSTPVFSANNPTRANVEDISDFGGSENIKPNEFDNISLVSLPISSKASIEESKCSFELLDERIYSNIQISHSQDSTVNSRLTHDSIFYENIMDTKGILDPLPSLSDEFSLIGRESFSEDSMNPNDCNIFTYGNDELNVLMETSGQMLLVPPIYHRLNADKLNTTENDTEQRDEDLDQNGRNNTSKRDVGFRAKQSLYTCRQR